LSAAPHVAVQEPSPQTTNRSRGAQRVLRELDPRVWPIAAWAIAYDALRVAGRRFIDDDVQAATATALDEVMQWICRAQDAADSGGIPAYFSLYGGWAVEYPETTGYLIPTLLEHAAQTGDVQYRERAFRAADWLLTLQFPDGSFPGGFATKEDGPSVFNTGQILNGLVAISAEADGSRYVRPASKAADWLVKMQSEDGAWRSATYEGRAHVYYTMVAWPLAVLGSRSGDRRYASAALRNVEFALRQQRQSDAWISGYNLGQRPNFLHFIAYTLQGMLEVGAIQANDTMIDSARRAVDRLLRHLESTGMMPGAFGDGWKPTASYACMTGSAQLAIVCMRLFEVTNEHAYLHAAVRLNELVKHSIWWQGPAGVRGAIKGSDPIWGGYLTLRYPNWAAKFAADAFRLELKHTKGATIE
jgi:hypothetical protein